MPLRPPPINATRSFRGSSRYRSTSDTRDLGYDLCFPEPFVVVDVVVVAAACSLPLVWGSVAATVSGPSAPVVNEFGMV